MADEGGNAVDAAIAAVLVSLVTEPSVCSLGGGAFVTVDPPAQPTVTIDGYVEMPGRGLAPERFGQGVRDVHIKYGGGVETTVGHGSIATPGALAGFGLASKAYGKLPWARVVEPAYDWARSGFPLSRTSRLYLEFCGEEIFGWHPESRAVLYGPDDRLAEAGDLIRIPDLAGSLERIARAGAQDLYRGELARMIAREIEGHGGILTLRDLGAYEPVVRTPAEVRLGTWTLATNPPPAIGGCSLAAMLALIGDGPPERLERGRGVREIVRAQQDRARVPGGAAGHRRGSRRGDQAVARVGHAGCAREPRALGFDGPRLGGGYHGTGVRDHRLGRIRVGRDAVGDGHLDEQQSR